MNKIYSDQIAKASMLSEGIRKNVETLKNQGIILNTEKMDTCCKALGEVALKQEAAEEALKEVRSEAHRLLDELKELCNENKLPIKQKFPVEKWINFGLADKR